MIATDDIYLCLEFYVSSLYVSPFSIQLLLIWNSRTVNVLNVLRVRVRDFLSWTQRAVRITLLCFRVCLLQKNLPGYVLSWDAETDT